MFFPKLLRPFRLFKMSYIKYSVISNEEYEKIYKKLNTDGTFKKIDKIMSNEIDDRIIRAQKLLHILDRTTKHNREICLVYILKSYGNHFY